MMAYNNNFVICVLHEGSPVREINRTVHLPFNSGYKIRLKNKNSFYRAKARVWVDGRKVSNLGDFILKPNETLDLERFLDQSMASGNKFKFVPLSDGRVNDPSDPENGLIKVEFYRELQNLVPLGSWKITYEPSPWKSPSNDYPTFSWNDTNAVPLTFTSKGTSSSSCYAQNLVSHRAVCDSAPGATVEGGHSNQNFTYGDDFSTEFFPTTLELRIRGLEKAKWEDKVEITPPHRHRKRQRRAIRFCPHCGRRRHRMADHFCQRCGTAYHPRYERERGRISR